jgi:hypothetical protein
LSRDGKPIGGPLRCQPSQGPRVQSGNRWALADGVAVGCGRPCSYSFQLTTLWTLLMMLALSDGGAVEGLAACRARARLD